MRIINIEEFDDKRTSNEKLNIQRIKGQRENNEKLIGNCTRNKKIYYEKKTKDEINRIEIKNDESIRDNATIKYSKEKKKEEYSNSIYPNFSCNIINSIKINFHDFKIQLINTESLTEQRYLKSDILNDIPKEKIHNMIVFNILFIIYIRIIIIKPILLNILNQCILNNLCNYTELPLILYIFINFIRYNFSEKEINEFNKYKYMMKNNKKIIKFHLNSNNFVINEEIRKNYNNAQFIHYSNYSFEKKSINNIIQINQRNIFINKIFNNKLHIKQSKTKISYESYWSKYKENYIYNKKSKYEYYDSLIKNNKILNFIFFIIKYYFFSDKTLIYQKLVPQHTMLFNKNVIIILIIGLIIIFTKKKCIKEKRKALNFMKEKKREIVCFKEKIIFVEIKKGCHKIINLIGKAELNADYSKLEEIPKKNRKYNIIKNCNTDNNYIIIVIILIKSIIIIILFYKTKSNILYYCFYQNSKITLKVKGIGQKQIIGNNFNQHIYEIYINTIKQKEKSQQYNFEQNDNSVEIFFIDNTNLANIQDMFNGCNDITEVDLSNFNSSTVTNMYQMFMGCSSLKSLNLSNLDISSVTNMQYMFSGCSSLISLNLSNLNASSVTTMYEMFMGCSSLISLDLSNFNTSSVIYMNNMFYNCVNLEYINLNNFNESKLKDYKDIFYSIKENVVICINEDITKEKIFPQIKNISCHVIECSNDWRQKQKKIIYNTNEFIESCDKSIQYKYEYNGKCYENCKNGLLKDENNNIINNGCFFIMYYICF